MVTLPVCVSVPWKLNNHTRRFFEIFASLKIPRFRVLPKGKGLRIKKTSFKVANFCLFLYKCRYKLYIYIYIHIGPTKLAVETSRVKDVLGHVCINCCDSPCFMVEHIHREFFWEMFYLSCSFLLLVRKSFAERKEFFGSPPRNPLRRNPKFASSTCEFKFFFLNCLFPKNQ